MPERKRFFLIEVFPKGLDLTTEGLVHLFLAEDKQWRTSFIGTLWSWSFYWYLLLLRNTDRNAQSTTLRIPEKAHVERAERGPDTELKSLVRRLCSPRWHRRNVFAKRVGQQLGDFAPVDVLAVPPLVVNRSSRSMSPGGRVKRTERVLFKLGEMFIQALVAVKSVVRFLDHSFHSWQVSHPFFLFVLCCPSWREDTIQMFYCECWDSFSNPNLLPQLKVFYFEGWNSRSYPRKIYHLKIYRNTGYLVWHPHLRVFLPLDCSQGLGCSVRHIGRGRVLIVQAGAVDTKIELRQEIKFVCSGHFVWNNWIRTSYWIILFLFFLHPIPHLTLLRFLIPLHVLPVTPLDYYLTPIYFRWPSGYRTNWYIQK